MTPSLGKSKKRWTQNTNLQTCNGYLYTCSAVSHRMQSRSKCMLLQGYSARFAEENARLDRSPVQKSRKQEARTCAVSKQTEIKITSHDVPSQES